MEPVLDHRSHADRGLHTKPQIHLGPRIAEMSRKGLSTTRGGRSRAIQEANAAALELDAQLLRRRREVLQAELEMQACIEAERSWRSNQKAGWAELLRNHPLTRPPGELKRLANAVGPEWDAVATPDGFWAIRPGQDSVVLLARGYVATDAQDEESFRAMLNAVPMLRMKQPLIAVKESLRATAQGLLKALGYAWRIVSTDAATQKQAGPRV
jgi:hypothetical protein